MERKTETDIAVEEFIIMAFEVGFDRLLLYLWEEAFKIEEEMGESGFSTKEMGQVFEKRAKKQIIEKLRMFFDQLIVEKDVPLSMISYCIKRCEGALERLKSRGALQVFVPEELNFLIPRMHLLIQLYVKILEETLLQLKFEYEVI